MGEAVFYDTLRQGLWITVVISMPILGVALAAGLVIGLAQALTSVQEMTLDVRAETGGHRRCLLAVDGLHDRKSGCFLHGDADAPGRGG